MWDVAWGSIRHGTEPFPCFLRANGGFGNVRRTEAITSSHSRRTTRRFDAATQQVNEQRMIDGV